MPRETILIDFKKIGDKDLIKSLNNLASAQARLNKIAQGSGGALKTPAKALTGTEVAVKKLSPAFASLSARIIANNKTWKDLGVSNKLAEKAMYGNKIALEKLRMAMAKANQEGIFTTKSNRLISNSFATLRSQMLLVSFGAMLINKAFVDLVKTYGRQEAVNEKLRAGLANVSGNVEGVTQRLVDYSSALQQTTAFGDELITNGMTQLTTFGLNEQAMKSLTPQVLNVARAIQTTAGAMPDLNSLFIAFGKATTTGIGTLTRYGVVLTDAEQAQLKTMNANDRAVKIAEILEKQYGGLAEAYAKTTAGMLESAAAARGDAAEALGEVLAPAVLAVSKAFKVLFEAMDVQAIKNYTAALAVASVVTTGFKLKAIGLSGALGAATKAFKVLNKVVKANPYVAAALAITAIGGALGKWFGFFEKEPLTDAEKKVQNLKKAYEEQEQALKDLKEAQESGEKSLQKRLDLLNATTEVEKMLINLGHEASATEKQLIEQIVARTEEIKNQKKASDESFATFLQKQEEAIAKKERESEFNQRIIKEDKELAKQLGLIEGGYEDYVKAQQEIIKKQNKHSDWNKDLIKEYPDLAKSMGLIPDTFDDYLKKQEESNKKAQTQIEFNKQLIQQNPKLAKALGLLPETFEDYFDAQVKSLKEQQKTENFNKQLIKDYPNIANALGIVTEEMEFQAEVEEATHNIFIKNTKIKHEAIKEEARLRREAFIEQRKLEADQRQDAPSVKKVADSSKIQDQLNQELGLVDQNEQKKNDLIDIATQKSIALHQEANQEIQFQHEQRLMAINSMDLDSEAKQIMIAKAEILRIAESKESQLKIIEAFKEDEAKILEFYDNLKKEQRSTEFSDTLSELEQYADAAIAIQDKLLDASLTRLNTQRKREIRDARNNISDQETLRAKLQQINDKYDDKERQKQKELKPVMVGLAIAKGALGVMNVWGDPTEGGFKSKLLKTALIAATTMQQVAAIGAQTFAKGGYLQGKSHAQGGIPIEAEGGEYIIRKQAVDQVGLPFLEKVNQGNVGVKQFANGGVVDPQAIDTKQKLNNLVADLSNPLHYSGMGNLGTISAVSRGAKANKYENGGLVRNYYATGGEVGGSNPVNSLVNNNQISNISSPSNVTVNVSMQGNVMTDDFTADTLVPAIKKALLRGGDLDHSHKGENVKWSS